MAKGFCRKTRLGLDWEMFTKATLGRRELEAGDRQACEITATTCPASFGSSLGDGKEGRHSQNIRLPTTSQVQEAVGPPGAWSLSLLEWLGSN